MEKEKSRKPAKEVHSVNASAWRVATNVRELEQKTKLYLPSDKRIERKRRTALKAARAITSQGKGTTIQEQSSQLLPPPTRSNNVHFATAEHLVTEEHIASTERLHLQESLSPRIESELHEKLDRDLPQTIEQFDDATVDTRLPEEWVFLGAKRGGTPAHSRFFHATDQDQKHHSGAYWEWAPCRVMSYDSSTQMYTIIWRKTLKEKKVHRLNLLFDAEDREAFLKRVELAIRKRDAHFAQLEVARSIENFSRR